MKRLHILFAIAVFVLGVMAGGEAWANGGEFFTAADEGPIDLVYVGRVKDARTGRQLAGDVYLTITDNPSGSEYPFMSDRPGHFRSPDIGSLLKDQGSPVDPKNFLVEVVAAGYKTQRLEVLPRKSSGTVEINVVLEPAEDAPPIAAADISGGITLTPMSMLLGLLALIMVGIGVRTIALRPSTAR